MGNALIFSLLLIVGIFIGAVIAFIITALKKKNEEHKASNIIEKAKKDAEKSKRDALLEAKEESYKLKLETEKEINIIKSDYFSQAKNVVSQNINRLDVNVLNKNSIEYRLRKVVERLTGLENTMKKLGLYIISVENNISEAEGNVKKILKGKFYYKVNYNINWKKKQYHFDEYSFCNWLQYTK